MADNDNFNSVSAAFKKAMEYLHKQKKYQPEMLADKSVLALINATNDVLSKELDNLSVKQDIPEDLVSTLRKNVFFFSGFKTHHELTEASRMLQSEDGGFKSFEKFYEDVKTIDKTYNRNYLKAEYNFATASTQMAVKWKEWEKSADRYDLQYRTAGDDHVREEHEALDGITLPMSDPFWNEYLPPMGWNCRCTAVRVRKGKYPTSDSDEAIQKGKNCTSKPKQQIFRFNPGKQEKIFPPKHPYFPKGCGNCDYKLSYDKNNLNCQACKCILSTYKTLGKASELIEKYDKKIWEHSYVSKNDDGFVVTELKRIVEGSVNKQESSKFKKEFSMCKVLADNGHHIEYLSGFNRAKGETYDINFDKTPADLKQITGGAGNVSKYAAKSYDKQGANIVVFEFPNHNKSFYNSLREIKKKYPEKKIAFYFIDDKKLRII